MESIRILIIFAFCLNLPGTFQSFSEWGEVLGDHVMASAVLDRILHHCTVFNIRGESYRMKDRKKIGNVIFQEVKK